jgi:hypothetical protein
VERHVGGRHQHPAEVDERLLVDGVAQILRRVRSAQPAPQHQVGAGRDRTGGVELHDREMTHRLEEIRRTTTGQQLSANGDPAGVGAAELVDPGHAASVGPSASGPGRG